MAGNITQRITKYFEMTIPNIKRHECKKNHKYALFLKNTDEYEEIPVSNENRFLYTVTE